MTKTSRRIALAGLSAGLMAMTALTGTAYAQTTLTFLIDNASNTVAQSEAMVAAFEAANPDINVEIETRPGGAEGDNII